MLTKYHVEMTRNALDPYFSERALEVIVSSNLRQDNLTGQVGHDEYHYDNNAIEKGDRYIAEQRARTITALSSQDKNKAWMAFGRLLHTAQDFYSHSNYVTMWLDQFDGTPPPPPEIDPLQKDLIESPQLHSSKVYMPMDALYFIPFLRPWMLKLLPKDSHGWMNLDSPVQGVKFPYAIAAGTKRSAYELELLRRQLTPEMFTAFIDRIAD